MFVGTDIFAARMSKFAMMTCVVVITGILPVGLLTPNVAHAEVVCSAGTVTGTAEIRFLADLTGQSCTTSTISTSGDFYVSLFRQLNDLAFEFYDPARRAFTSYSITNYIGAQSSLNGGETISLEDAIPSSSTSSTLTIVVTFGGTNYTITIEGLTKVDGVASATFTRATISGGVFDTSAPSSPHARAVSQQATSSAVFTNQSASLFSAGVTGAIAQRFRGGTGADFSLGQAGSFGSAFMSTQGVAEWMQKRSTQRLREDDVVSIYNPLQPNRPPHDTPLEAHTAQDAIASNFSDAVLDASEEANSQALGYAPHGMTVDPIEDAQAPWNIWARGSFTHFNGDAFDGDAWAGVLGIDYLLTDRVLVGVMGGYEAGDFTFPLETGAFQGDGLSFGVYTGVQLSEFLIAEAYVAHSLLDYENITATGVGITEARRTLASFNLVGSHALTERITLEPNARISYAHERQKAYVMSDGTAIGTEVIDSGTLSIGTRISYLLPFETYGQFRVFASGHGEYAFSSQDETGSTLPDFDDLTSGRFGLGLDALFLNGWQLTLDGNVGGIGSESFLSYTGNGRLRIPLN